VFQVASPESGGPISACSSLSYRLKEFVVNWFTRYAFGFHAGEWLALAMGILMSFALCIASLRLALWLLTRKRDTDKSEGEGEKEYWRIHEG
jgi:hypothetical protein